MQRTFSVAVVLLLGLSAGYAQQAPKKVLTDGQLNAAGPWTFFANPWGSYALPKGSYSNTIAIEADADPVRFTIQHHYDKGFPFGVRGYPAVEFGAGRGAKPRTPWPARQVKDIVDLTQTYSVRLDNVTGAFNLLAETFAVRSADDNSSGALEIGWHLHPTPTLFDFLTHKGVVRKDNFTDRDATIWRIYVAQGDAKHPPYVNAVPEQGDRLSGKLDWSGLFKFLVAQNLLTGEEWFRGAFFGDEPVNGDATIHVDSLSGLIDGPARSATP